LKATRPQAECFARVETDAVSASQPNLYQGNYGEVAQFKKQRVLVCSILFLNAGSQN
jgi:hypothetical protein